MAGEASQSLLGRALTKAKWAARDLIDSGLDAFEQSSRKISGRQPDDVTRAWDKTQELRRQGASPADREAADQAYDAALKKRRGY